MAGLKQYGLASHVNNDMTRLLNDIELRLQLKGLPLPEQCAKNTWAELIIDQSLKTFSIYFQYPMSIIVTPELYKDGFYFLDTWLPEGCKLLGVQDIDFMEYKSQLSGFGFSKFGYQIDAWGMLGQPDIWDNVGLSQVSSDLRSLFNLGIYPVVVPPNKVRLESVNRNVVNLHRPFPLKILIEHPGLHTISPTMYETWIKICMVDVSDHILQYIKYHDGQDTVYGSIDLKLDRLNEWSNKRDDVINEYKEATTTTANEALPIIMTV